MHRKDLLKYFDDLDVDALLNSTKEETDEQLDENAVDQVLGRRSAGRGNDEGVDDRGEGGRGSRTSGGIPGGGQEQVSQDAQQDGDRGDRAPSLSAGSQGEAGGVGGSVISEDGRQTRFQPETQDQESLAQLKSMETTHRYYGYGAMKAREFLQRARLDGYYPQTIITTDEQKVQNLTAEYQRLAKVRPLDNPNHEDTMAYFTTETKLLNPPLKRNYVIVSPDDEQREYVSKDEYDYFCNLTIEHRGVQDEGKIKPRVDDISEPAIERPAPLERDEQLAIRKQVEWCLSGVLQPDRLHSRLDSEEKQNFAIQYSNRLLEQAAKRGDNETLLSAKRVMTSLDRSNLQDMMGRMLEDDLALELSWDHFRANMESALQDSDMPQEQRDEIVRLVYQYFTDESPDLSFLEDMNDEVLQALEEYATQERTTGDLITLNGVMQKYNAYFASDDWHRSDISERHDSTVLRRIKLDNEHLLTKASEKIYSRGERLGKSIQSMRDARLSPQTENNAEQEQEQEPENTLMSERVAARQENGVTAQTPDSEPPSQERAEGETPEQWASRTAEEESESQAVVEAKKPVNDFHYEREDKLIPSGQKTRIRANIDAIGIVKDLEREDRVATDEEKKTLAKYSGWGAVKEVLNEHAADKVRFYERNNMWDESSGIPEDIVAWRDNYIQFYYRLKSLLTEKEWEAASASVLNAHYTDEQTCHQLWDMARQLGFDGGTVLEPAVGTGNILGAMPADMRQNSDVIAVEKDAISAQIAKHLYPNTRVENTEFQNADIKNNSVDLVITNVPFSNTKPAGQDPEQEQLNLHNYFISRSLDKIKDGGLSVVITSASTLQNNQKQREYLAAKGQFLGGMRLPNDAFKESANTEVVTDILVFRKGMDRQMDVQNMTSVMPAKVDDEEAFVDPHDSSNVVDFAPLNEYFLNHPEMLLGKNSMKGKMYGGSDEEQYTVKSDGRNLEQSLTEAIKNLPAGIFNARSAPVAEVNYADVEEKTYSLVDRDGEVMYVDYNFDQHNRRLLSFDEYLENNGITLPRGVDKETAREMAKGFVGIKQSMKAVFATDLSAYATEKESQQQRQKLREQYHNFVEKFGQINAKSGKVGKLFGRDPEIGTVQALESVVEYKDERGRKQLNITEAAILNERTLYPAPTPKAESISDAIMLSKANTGRVSVEYIADVLGVDANNLEQLEKSVLSTGLAYKEPNSGTLETRTKYLSGNVVNKLKEARKAAEEDSTYVPNVEALEAIQPPVIPIEQLDYALESTWLPMDMVEDFAKDVLGQRNNFEVKYFPRADLTYISKDYVGNSQVNSVYGVDGMNGMKIFEKVLNNSQIKINYKEKQPDGSTKSIYDAKATAQARSKADQLKQEWVRWVKNDEQRKKRIEEQYNNKFNNYVLPEYDGSHLTFDSMAKGSDGMTPRKHQADVVARGIEEQSGLIAHDVGYGKTLSSILIAHESKRLGLSSKPMVVCDNASYPQFVESIRTVYPQAKVLTHESGDSMGNKEQRNAFLARIATNDWDFVVVPQSQFDMIPNSPETEKKFINTQVDDMRATLEAVDQGELHMGKRLKRSIQKKLESYEEKIKKLNEEITSGNDNNIHFEDLGVDMLVVDEVHKYKKIPFATKHNDVKGIDTQPSSRATNLWKKASWLHSKRDGKGVIGLTATPITNTMAEAWNMVRLTQPNILKEFNVERFDEFVATFCKKVSGMEINEANGKWREVQRLAEFKNGVPLINMMRAAMDVKNDPETVGLKLPNIKNGGKELVQMDQTESVSDILATISEIYENYEALGGDEKQDYSFVPIMLMQVGMAASIDPRLVDPTAPDEKNSLVNNVVDNVVRIAEETKDDRSAQVVFCDRYSTMDTTALEKLMNEGIKSVDAQPEEDTKVDQKQVEEADEKRAQKFNLYKEMKRKLVAKGFREDEVLIINDAKNKKERDTYYEKINSGEARVIIGSTGKLGTGINIQEKMKAAHHVDPPRSMTPSDMTQRDGRVVRQGNENEEVEVLTYGMTDTVTPAIFHRIQRKGEFIGQALAGKGAGMEFSDPAGSLDLENFKSSLISDKRALRRSELLNDIREESMAKEVTEDSYRQLVTEKRLAEEQISIANNQYEKSRHIQEEWQDMPELISEDSDVYLEKFDMEYGGEDLTREKTEEGDIQKRSPEKFLKRLNEQIHEWQDTQMSWHERVKELGVMTIGGINVAVQKSKEDNMFRRGASDLKCYILDPRNDKKTVASCNISSGKGLVRWVNNKVEEFKKLDQSINKKVETSRENLKQLEERIESYEHYDSSKLESLQQELQDLETDLRNNPSETVKQRKERKQAKGGEEEEYIADEAQRYAGASEEEEVAWKNA